MPRIVPLSRADAPPENAVVRGGIVTRDRLVVFGGGFPIREDSVFLGAIGACGGMEEHDEECARAALAAIGADVV